MPVVRALNAVIKYWQKNKATTPGTRHQLAGALRIVRVIGRVHGAIAEQAVRFAVFRVERERWMAVKLDAAYQADRGRERRQRARNRLRGRNSIPCAWRHRGSYEPSPVSGLAWSKTSIVATKK